MGGKDFKDGQEHGDIDINNPIYIEWCEDLIEDFIEHAKNELPDETCDEQLREVARQFVAPIVFVVKCDLPDEYTEDELCWSIRNKYTEVLEWPVSKFIEQVQNKLRKRSLKEIYQNLRKKLEIRLDELKGENDE